MEDAIIISDIHLGSDNCQAKDLNHFLDNLPETKRLILNGDVFDSWDFRRLKSSHFKILAKLRHLSTLFEVIWIHGNHDGPSEIVSHLLGSNVHEEYIFVSGGKKIICTHGDKFDDFITDYPITVLLADYLYHFLQKLDNDFYWAKLAKMSSKTFLKCIEKVKTKAIKYKDKMKCDLICVGHTHCPEANDGTYFNSGCWTEKTSTFLVVNNGAINLEKYEENNTSI